MKTLGTILSLIFLLVGCADLEKPCLEACERPYQLSSRRGGHRIATWEQMPADLKAESKPISQAWQKKIDASRSDYLGQCLSSCQQYATKAEIECRRRAGNLGEWKRCGK